MSVRSRVPARVRTQPRKAVRQERMAALNQELREKNTTLLFWCVAIFNPLYISWTLLDWLLVPEQWHYFLWLRIAAVTVNTSILIPLKLKPERSMECFWVWGVVWPAFIAPMLPFAGSALLPYVLGMGLVILGIGVLPVWQVRWNLAIMLAAVASLGLSFLIWPTQLAIGPLLTTLFFLGTAIPLSSVTAWFKYELSMQEFIARQELEEERRVTEALREVDRQKSEDLAAALDRLKELDRLKSQFFANISHELRTPLTLILGPLDDQLSKPLPKQSLHQLRVIRNNAGRLLRLIDELLDLSRLDAGGLRLNIAEVDLCALAATVYENGLPLAHSSGIDFTLDADEPVADIYGDASRLEIVLTNLVGNALKYVPGGGSIAIRVASVDGGGLVEVRDTGPGIPAEDLPRIFERFYQVGARDRRRRKGGVGIGLALAKELAELHDGRLTVESEVGEGSSFQVWLPPGRDHFRPEVIERRKRFNPNANAGRRLGDPCPDPTGDPELLPELPLPELDPGLQDSPANRALVLLVEDQDELRAFLRQLLEPDFAVVEARDGGEGWKLASEKKPDLVISDVMMPGTSGTDLCKAIKADPRLQSTPVILLTARVGSEATLEAYAHGADDFVAKPFHPRVLVARVHAQLKLRALSLKLIGQEKLAAIGTLAAGVAHEVQNPLNAMLNAARALKGNEFPRDVGERLLGIVVDGGERIASIVAALDTHARPAEQGGVQRFDVRGGLDATLRLLEHRMDSVTVHRDYEEGCEAMVPAGPINQVFLNLLDNALRAGASNLWVETRGDDIAVRVTVRDDGAGVDPAIAARIFDAFFTTRDPGDGTGLGLYLSQRIVVENGGGLRLRSDADDPRTTFEVTLPSSGEGAAVLSAEEPVSS